MFWIFKTHQEPPQHPHCTNIPPVEPAAMQRRGWRELWALIDGSWDSQPAPFPHFSSLTSTMAKHREAQQPEFSAEMSKIWIPSHIQESSEGEDPPTERPQAAHLMEISGVYKGISLLWRTSLLVMDNSRNLLLPPQPIAVNGCCARRVRAGTGIPCVPPGKQTCPSLSSANRPLLCTSETPFVLQSC